MWKNVIELGRQWHMHIVCCMSNATSTHTEYVLLIDFQLQQWLHERA